MPYSATLCCDPHWSELCSETSWPCCMWLPWKSEPSEVAEKPLFYCAAARDCRTHVGVLEWRILFTKRPVRVNFVLGKRRQIAQNKVVVWAFLGVDLFHGHRNSSHYVSVLAVINKFVEKADCFQRLVPAVLSLCFVNSEPWAATPRLLPLPVNNAFVFLKEKKAIAFVELCICFMSSVLLQRLCKDYSVKKN